MLQQPLRLSFVCGQNESFLRPIVDRLSERHSTRKLFGEGEISEEKVQRLMDWADVTWFEWCDEIVENMSRRLEKTSSVVCRLHSYEIFSEHPANVDWEFVDRLVCVADHIEAVVRSKLSDESLPDTVVIPNGIDLDAFTYADRAPGFELAYVGYINYKKAPALLMQCLAELLRRDDRYRLHVAGRHQDMQYYMYLRRLIAKLGVEDRIQFDGWVEDVNGWLEEKNYLVSTSIFESFGMGIAEAMAKGIKPVIHDWVGARFVYPEKYLFRTVREFSEIVLEGDYRSRAYRDYVANRYALADTSEKIADMLDDLCRLEDAPETLTGSTPSPTG